MKKTFFSFFITFISTLVFSQEWKDYDWQEWKDYKLDENVTVQISSEILITNLQGGGKLYSCNTVKGAYIFSVSPPSENFKASDAEAMNKIYSNLIEGYLNGSHGKLINTETIFNGNLEGRNVRSYMAVNGMPVISETHFFLLGNKIYQFQCVQQESMYDSLDVGQTHFFEFARFVKKPQSQAQFSNPVPDKSTAKKLGHSVGYAFGLATVLPAVFLLFTGVIVAITFIIRNRKIRS